MKKKLFFLFLVLTLLVCGMPVSAAYVEKISVPQASQVLFIYQATQADSGSESLPLRISDQSVIQKICASLGSLTAGVSVLNMPSIPAADLVLELRMANGSMMRYHLYSKAYGHEDRIISQKVEHGVVYQGMAFTAGNVSTVVNQLLQFEGNGKVMMMPFTLNASDIEALRLFDYNDLTYTQVIWGPSLEYVVGLLRVLRGAPNDNRPMTVASSDTGKQIADMNEMVIELKDGTRVTCVLYEKGLAVRSAVKNLNVTADRFFRVEGTVYQQLISYLRSNQSNSAPSWFGSMSPYRITKVAVVSPNGTKIKTASIETGGGFDALIETLRSTAVVPLSMTKRAGLSNQANAYGITIWFNSGVTYTIEYGEEFIEVSSSDMSFSTHYRLSGSTDTKYLQAFLAK